MIRINKWLSEMGVCSRKQADRLIAEQRVTVNQQVAKLGMLINSTDQVMVDDKLVIHKPHPVFILYHKPVGVICTHDLEVENNIEQVVDYPERVFAVGRLDKDSEGLMLLTNQGDVVNKIMRAENAHAKTYRVWVDKPITDRFLTSMAEGVEILNTITLPCRTQKIDEHCFEIELTQGLNRQIRRMCKALGYRVVRLQRIQIMQFELGSLAENDKRQLTDQEVMGLLKSLKNSINEIT